MQTYLPLIQTMLSEWYLVTLNNPLYAGALVASAWLFTAILYSIRIGGIKRANTASEKNSIESLNELQKRLQDTQEELTAADLQMEKAASTAQEETQRALTLEQLIYQRNKQIADMIQLLATNFDLGERPLLATEDVKADQLWQQHTKVITLLIERLRTEQQAKKELQQTCQAETAKLAEKEVLLDALQSTLDTHGTQLSKLERALEEQKTILQQQDNVQQVLSDTLKNYKPVITSPAELIQEAVKPAIQFAASPKPVESFFTPAAPQSPVVETPTIAVQIPPVTPIKTMEAIKPVLPANKPEAPSEEPSYASLDLEQQPVTATKGSLGKIKNLFGKKQTPVKTEPQWAETKPVETEVLPMPEPELAIKEVQKAPGKLQGFYSKFKSKNK
ncbi:MAG: hypothetical protein NTX38_07395 [Methylobacter sp.]|nr:hypothetical protein [Methylobacter sp.]